MSELFLRLRFFNQDWHPNQHWSQLIQKQMRLLGLQDITRQMQSIVKSQSGLLF